MSNKEMNEKILNKKFKKTIFSGYETEDVDSFFDEVIEYLKKNDSQIEDLEKNVATLRSENQKLLASNAKLTSDAETYKKLALELDKEGYGHVMHNRFAREKREKE